VDDANAHWILAVNKNAQIQPLSILQKHRLAIPWSSALWEVKSSSASQKFPSFFRT
jgi:hypothetical protein